MCVKQKKAALECDGPLWLPQRERVNWHPDFSKSQWEPEWIFLRVPQEENYRRGGGALRLYPSPIHFSDAQNPTFAAFRPWGFHFQMEAEFTFEPCEEGDEAGLAIVLSSGFYYRFVKRKTEQGVFLVLEKNAEDMEQISCRIAVETGTLRLRIAGDKEAYHFYYSTAGGEDKLAATASTRFLSCEVAGRSFTGTVMGLYTASCGKTAAVMNVTAVTLTKASQ